MLITVRPQSIDLLGRILPRVVIDTRLDSATLTSREAWELVISARQHGRRDASNALVRWCRSLGITHGPADLAGYRPPLEIQPKPWWEG